jgi:hypothetical protein
LVGQNHFNFVMLFRLVSGARWVGAGAGVLLLAASGDAQLF